MAKDGLQLRHLCISLGGVPMVEMDETVVPGDVLTIMGPSGSGKSTILSVITGTTDPVFDIVGDVILNGVDLQGLPTEARRVGILFQDDHLFPHMSVGGNLAFGLHPALRGRKERQARVAQALSEIGMEGFSDRDPATLSGGQRARIALMRVLLSDPELLLLDEPFSKLDAARRDQIRDLVFGHAKKRRLPVLLVTHDPADAQAAGGRVVTLGELE